MVEDCGTPPLNSSINFTFYLNYDSYDLPKSVLNTIQRDMDHARGNDALEDEIKIDQNLNLIKADPNLAETIRFNSKRDRNFFQLVSSSVLIVILMGILIFMIFIACFIFVTIYKRSMETKPKFIRKNNNISRSSNSTCNSSTISYQSSSVMKCLNQLKDCIRARCSLNKVPSFRNLSIRKRAMKKTSL